MYRGNKLRNGLFDVISNSSILGDINNDSIVDILDIIILINLILVQEPTEEQMLLADINNDGILSILDIVLMISIALDLP